MLKENIVPQGNNTRYIFFSGKGGVGKTTISAATAVWLANQGYKTLIISTDLQMSLNDVFGYRLESTPTDIPGVKNLKGVTLDVPESMERNRKQIIETLKMVDPESPMLKQMEMDKQSDCGCAQAAVFEFSKYLNTKNEFDVIVFDTAPIGTTLEKINSQAKFVLNILNQIEVKQQLAAEFGLANVNEQIRALEEVKKNDHQALENLKSDKTSFIMITIPEGMPVAEVERNIPVLENQYGIMIRGIVINNIIPDEERSSTPFWKNKWSMQNKYINLIYRQYREKPIGKVQLLESEVLGVKKLIRIGHQLYGGK